MSSDAATLPPDVPEVTTTPNGRPPEAGMSLTRGDDLDCFVLPDEERLSLAAPFDSLWVEIKRELTVWERDTVTAAMLRSVKTAEGEQEVGIDTARGRFIKFKTYLTDWNFSDRKGKRVPVSDAAIRNLRPALADAIEAAIDAHVQKLADLLSNPKKGEATAS